MGLSRVDIYNLALSNIKVGEILDHEDDDAARRFLLPQSWTHALGKLLSRHEWNFATVVRKLAKVDWDGVPGAINAIAPGAIYGAYGWEYPADCSRLLGIGRVIGNSVDFATKYPWQIEAAGANHGRVIRAMHDHVCARYVTNAVPEAYWPEAFANALVWALSAQIARGVNATYSDAESCMKQAEEAFIAARSLDVSEQGRAIPRNGNLIESRDWEGEPPIGDEDLFSVANFGMAAYSWRDD